MDNLIALGAIPLRVEDSAGIKFVASDGLRNAVFVALQDKRIVGFDEKNKKELFAVDIPCSSDILGMHCMPELDSIVITCTDGTLLLLNMDEQSFEPVGDLEGGILCSSVSPDGELLLCLTATGTMIVFNSEWDVLVEKELGASERPAGDRPTVAWCADGLKFALLDTRASGKRFVSVFDRNCVLEAKSEDFEGVGSGLAFSPDGALIATSQQHSQRHDIIFFEPNALRHYEFTLPEHSASCSVSALQWNADGTLLSLCLRDVKRGSETLDALQIWRRSNYHWYLKYEVVSDAAGAPRHACACVWDESDPFSALLSVGSAGIERWTFDAEYQTSIAAQQPPDTSSASEQPPDLCVVASIDGQRLLLTPLGKMIVPPPMCAAAASFPAPITSLAWGPGGRLAVVTSDGSLHQCEPPFLNAAQAGWEVAPQIEALHALRARGKDLFQLAWASERLLLAVSEEGARLVPLILPSDKGSNEVLGSAKTAGAQDEKLPGGVRRLLRESGSGKCVAQLEDGSVVVLEEDPRTRTAAPASASSSSSSSPSSGLVQRRVGKLGAQCRWVALLPGGGVLGQTRRLKLLLGEEAVLEGVSSVCVHDRFLLCTSTANKLLILPLEGATQRKEGGWKEGWKGEEDARFVERGTVLVGAARGGHKVVLALPRGNLEVVMPRVLVLHTVCATLDKGEFEPALRLMRAQKVDMNLTHDHNPAAFLQALPTLVRQASPHLLSLLISALRPDDVTVSTYPNAPPPSSSALVPKAAPIVGGATVRKVDVVCDAMLAALEEVDNTKLLACKVLTFVRRDPPQVEAAVRSLQAQEQSVQEDGLEVLMGLVDSKVVFDAALGLYDLELAAVAAQVGGQDPREYVPMLERLSALPDRLCCYEIDVQLKRYASAVKHAVAAGAEEWERAWTLAETHGLYAAAVDALEGVEGRELHLRHALCGLGADLVAKGRAKEGGLALLGGGDAQGASAALLQAGDWEAAFALMQQHGAKSDDELQRVCYGAAEAMREAGDGRGAARVYLEYCKDVEEAVMALCEARGWVEAGRVAQRHGRADLVPTCVAPSLDEAATACAEDVARRDEALHKVVERLAEVAKEKQAKEEEEARRREDGEDEDGEGGSGLGDDRSERSVANQSQASVHSKSSRSSRSSRSSKSNKTRSSARVPKPGDPWEEEYLIAQRASLLPTDAYKRDFGRVVEALALSGLRQRARELQAQLRALEAWIALLNLDAFLPPPPPPPDLVWHTVSLA
eukprot:CAMPEP_0177706240 /NCGR_PEP_ID=MMETSP0484_2-20121128/9121_1 /TAXON_ID=354590 /ORGANISM="Rhodomonas lens, Strain RHODO" /LENGTH=1245 /DNA_ID=CAMNT_0019217691 /DNA_START=54 /DNA_END=3791 /DNA_ORIENTATION=-